MIDRVSHESDSFVEVRWTRLIADYHETRFHSKFDNSSIWYLHIVLRLLLLLREVAYNSRRFHSRQELVYRLIDRYSSLDQRSSFCYERAQSSTETHVLWASLDSIEPSAHLLSVHIVFAPHRPRSLALNSRLPDLLFVYLYLYDLL